jgi:DNA-binding response OmpR family regulator
VTGKAPAGALARHGFEFILLDLGLPLRDASTCCATEARDDSTPVLVITARDAVDQRIEGLDRGADDYLVKPFAVGELLARMRALGRRRAGAVAPCLGNGVARARPGVQGRHVSGTRHSLPIASSRCCASCSFARRGAVARRARGPESTAGAKRSRATSSSSSSTRCARSSARRRSATCAAGLDGRARSPGRERAMNLSLRRRLFAWLGAWILVVGLLAAALAFAIEYDGANKLQDTQLKQIAAVLALNPLPPTAMSFEPRSLGDKETHLVIKRLGARSDAEPAPASRSPNRCVPAADDPAGRGPLARDRQPGRPRPALRGRAAHGAAQRPRARGRRARAAAAGALDPGAAADRQRVLNRAFAPMAAMSAEVDRLDGSQLAALDERPVPLEALPLVQAINRMMRRSASCSSSSGASSRTPRTSCARRSRR